MEDLDDIKETREAKHFIDQMLDMMVNTEGCPLEYKVLKADGDFTNMFHKLLEHRKFRRIDNNKKAAIISYLEQGTELLNDIYEKMINEED